MKSFIAALPFLAASVSAHLTLQGLTVDGASTGLLTAGAVRHNWADPQSNYPIKDATLPENACNKWGTTKAGKTVTIKAGSKFTAEFHHEPTLRSGDADEPIAASHKGPVMAYLGKVDSAATASPAGVKWFKIYEDGKDASGSWGVDRLIARKGLVDMTIPDCVAPGDYFLRTEVVALHEADASFTTGRGAQMYPNCAQITISGGGSAAPATVDFPGAYTNGGTGLMYNIYGNSAPYTAPGPKVFTCAAGGAAPAPASSAAAPAPASSSSKAAAAPSSSKAPSAPASSKAASSAAPTTLVTSTSKAYGSYPSTSAVAAIPATSAAPVAPSASGGAVRPTKQQVADFWTELQKMYADWESRGRP